MFMASGSSSVSVLDESEEPLTTVECAVVDELDGITDGVHRVELETVSSLKETRGGVVNNGNNSVNRVGDAVGSIGDVRDRCTNADWAASTLMTWEKRSPILSFCSFISLWLYAILASWIVMPVPC